MIRSLRSKHRVIWRLLAFLLPALIALALWSRPVASTAVVTSETEDAR
ncbi:MAG: hypothetical protein AAGK22_24505 [Acidobacteriota bacterium]